MHIWVFEGQSHSQYHTYIPSIRKWPQTWNPPASPSGFRAVCHHAWFSAGLRIKQGLCDFKVSIQPTELHPQPFPPILETSSSSAALYWDKSYLPTVNSGMLDKVQSIMTLRHRATEECASKTGSRVNLWVLHVLPRHKFQAATQRRWTHSCQLESELERPKWLGPCWAVRRSVKSILWGPDLRVYWALARTDLHMHEKKLPEAGRIPQKAVAPTIPSTYT